MLLLLLLACHIHAGLPDPLCTPGVLNPAVTQANIQQTICKSGWTITVRPLISYTNHLKLFQMIQYGLTGKPSEFEEDHLVPLELGGHPTDHNNLWPQPWKGKFNAHDKDKVENWLRKQVCAERLPLQVAQKAIASDWTALIGLK